MPEVIIDGFDKTAIPLKVNSDGSIDTISSSSGTGINDFSLRFTQRIEYNGSNLPLFIGLAIPGTNIGSSTWHIRKYIYNGFNATEVLFASGTNQFVNIWSGTTINRTTYPYS